MKRLLHENRNINLTARTHIKCQACGTPFSSNWSLLTIQSRLLGEFQASKRPCLDKTGSMVLEKQYLISTLTCTQTHTERHGSICVLMCACAQTDTHTYTNLGMFICKP